MASNKIPYGKTIQVPAAIHPISQTALAHVQDIRATENVATSIPYGPGARPDSPRLYGGSNVGG